MLDWGGGAVLGPVPAEHLPVHYGWADRLLSPPVGGVDLWVTEEAEQGVTFVGEVLDEPPVRVAVGGPVDDSVEIAVVVGTSASPVDWAPEDKAPAVTGTPSRPSSFEVFPNDRPST